MERKRLTLDSPVFEGKLRYTHRSSAYVQRPSKHVSSSGMVDVILPPQAKPLIPPPATPHIELPAVSITPLRQWAVFPPTTATHVPKPPVSRATSEMTVSKRRRMPSVQTTVLYIMASLVFVGGAWVSWNGVKTNHQVTAQVTHAQKQTEQTVADNVVPSTDKPSDVVVRNYAVAPNLPRYLDIPKLKVHTRTLSEGVTKGGELQVPWNIYDTGWYNASAQPGQNGAMLIDGHSGIGKTHGVFNHLADLGKGDLIAVTRGDGTKFNYLVSKVQTMNVKDVDMGSMLVSDNTARPGLNLVTCAGDLIPGTTELNKRVLVYAVLQ